MTYKGHIRNGVVVLDDPVALPEGATLTIALATDNEVVCDDETTPTLYEQFESVIGIAKGLPSDLARNHDHYLHGQPKK